MSNNQMMKIIERRGQTPIESTSMIREEKPTIKHEIDRNILEMVRKEGPLTRSKLVSSTGIARSTLYDSLMRLIVKGYVISYSEDRKHRGRPKTYFTIVR